MDLFNKVSILKPILADINEMVKLQNKSADKVQVVELKVQARTQHFWQEWNRQLECLGMAQKLDHTAWNLEKDGQYAMSEKLYRQALSIKHKNLGLENIETVKQNADLARVTAAQGRKTEACQYYETALLKLKTMPNARETYALMLESYGDMLDQMKQKAKADKIYEEARLAHKKTASTSP